MYITLFTNDRKQVIRRAQIAEVNGAEPKVLTFESKVYLYTDDAFKWVKQPQGGGSIKERIHNYVETSLASVVGASPTWEEGEDGQ